ncbi:unnamed protein product [Brassica oleracea var. botrytis]
MKERVPYSHYMYSSLSPGVWWRVRARTGAGGSVLASLFFSVAAASTVLLPLRYAQVYGLGFGSGDCSAAEGLRLRQFLCFLWFLGEKVELWLGAAVGSLGLNLDRFHLRSGPFLLLVRRKFGLTLLGRRWVSPSGLECHLARAGVS